MSSHANKTPKNPGIIPGSHRVKVQGGPGGEAIKNPRWTSKSKPIVKKGPSAKRGGSKKKTKKLRKTMRKRKGTKSKKTKRHHKRR